MGVFALAPGRGCVPSGPQALCPSLCREEYQHEAACVCPAALWGAGHSHCFWPTGDKSLLLFQTSLIAGEPDAGGVIARAEVRGPPGARLLVKFTLLCKKS